MALSTVKISDTIEWAKRLSFNRNPVIGNSLEPALSSANMVMQTILGPPFSWWWNNEEIVFTCNPTPKTATITNIAIVGGVLTVTCSNTFSVGELILPSGVGTTTALNGQILEILTASSTQFTAATTVPNVGSHVDTGTITSMSTQDYTTASPEFSHIEHASVFDINPTPGQWIELEIKNNLSLDSTPDRPRFASPHVEDGNGNMTWRVMPPPDKAYPIAIHIQKTAPLLNSVNSTWSPIPDYMQYVYNWGFLTLMWFFADDPRANFANQKFTAGLLARAEGLEDEEKNAFLNNWNNLTSQQMMKDQQGVQARGV
jgi:hypothetical protein